MANVKNEGITGDRSSISRNSLVCLFDKLAVLVKASPTLSPSSGGKRVGIEIGTLETMTFHVRPTRTNRPSTTELARHPASTVPKRLESACRGAGETLAPRLLSAFGSPRSVGRMPTNRRRSVESHRSRVAGHLVVTVVEGVSSTDMNGYFFDSLANSTRNASIASNCGT